MSERHFGEPLSPDQRVDLVVEFSQQEIVSILGQAALTRRNQPFATWGGHVAIITNNDNDSGSVSAIVKLWKQGEPSS